MRTTGFTRRDGKLVALIVEGQKRRERSAVRYAASKLHVTEHAIRKQLYRLRIRFDRASEFVEEYERWRRKIRGRRYL